MLFDTDVLIWTLRGNEKAVMVIEGDPERAVSVVTCMELFQGARDKREADVIRRLLSNFKTVALSEEIGFRACLYMEQFALMVDLAPVDALIAATAVEHQEVLCTGNAKHFRQVSGLTLRVFRP